MTATCMIYDQRLKAELQSLRRKGATSLCISRDEANDQPPFLGGRACTRCRGELGRIINRGANCPSCNQRVCKSCRHYDTNRWLCLVCYKQIEQLSGPTSESNGSRISNGRVADRAELINANIQRSCSFSDVDPPAWSFLRCSPDMRAYSSMPRNRIIEYNTVRLVGHSNESRKVDENDTKMRHFTNTTNSLGNSPEPEAKLSEILKEETPEYLSPTFGATPVTSPEQSPVIDKKNLGSPILRSTFIRNLSLRKKEGGHTWYIPPGVTPPRSRRRLNTGDSSEEHEGPVSSMTVSAATSMCCTADSDDYRLVFISSSDSSSREELASDDNSLLDEADWDYFECTKYSDSPTECASVALGWGPGGGLGGPNGPRPAGDFVHLQGQASHPYPSSASRPATVGQCVPIHVPIPVPFPFPIPVFVPVPVPTTISSRDYEMTSTNHPDSEILPIDECLCHKAVSPAIQAREENKQNENNVVLKVYKTFDEIDLCPIIPCTPEDLLCLREARLKDFTDYKDDDSSSSASTSDDEVNGRAPKRRVYKLHDDDSSVDFDIAASPPVSLTSASASESSDDEQNTTAFRRTFVLHESSSENDVNDDDNDDSDDKNTPPPEVVSNVPEERLPLKIVPTIEITDGDNDESHSKLSEEPHRDTRYSVENGATPVNFSHDELVNIVSEFLNQERKTMSDVGEKTCESAAVESKPETNVSVLKANSQTEADAGLKSPETRSNASDEFSGTESMEMPLEDSLECRRARNEAAEHEGGAEERRGGQGSPCSGGRVGESSSAGGSPSGGRRLFTSLVMITQENGPSGGPTSDASASRIDDAKAATSSVCLEEGLADDDSWVEDLDREEIVTTTEESSEEEGPYPDREEELRGYHRSAIDFTLHTIAEESCEESEVEHDVKRPTELEKYFFYGLGGVGNGANDRNEVVDSVVDYDDDVMSETSSIFSEGVESNVSAGAEDETSSTTSKNYLEPSELASSRLEKYFLSGFMGFRRDSDGSVGSDSEGRPSPEQRRKRLVRARGTGRSSHSTSLDNLLVEQPSGGEQPDVTNDGGDGSSTETDSHDELVTSFDKLDGQFDTVKRSNNLGGTTKKKKRSVPSCDEMTTNFDHLTDDSGGNRTPQPTDSEMLSSRTKQQSRDSGFVGSCDDLLKESRSSETDERKIDETERNGETTTATIATTASVITPSAGLIRKDSFNNWSSDEETNLMMSKMRAFFKTMIGSSATKTNPDSKLSPRPKKPPQLVYFENELTRLMKTVPGLKDEQVREIVEYLSSEDTWSDSYDSSDYTSSDLENSTKRSALQEEISASCRQIISNFETSPTNRVDDSELDGDQDLVYQRLVASFNRIEQAKSVTSTKTPSATSQNSPLLIEKVMSHIGTRLWALMHEVSGENQNQNQYHKRLSSKISTTTTEEEEDDDDLTAIGDYADVAALPRSKSHDPLLEELGRQEAASDNERFSWRGSFESALMAASDSRTRLVSAGDSCASSASALAAKRRSAGDLIAANCSSREQLDRVRSCGSIGAAADEKIWPRRRRRSSVPDSCDDSEDDSNAAGHRATLPRSLQSSSNTTNSLPRLPIATGTPIYKSHSVSQFGVKSARYRPPGYRGSPMSQPPPPPVRRDRNKRHNSSSSSASTAAATGCDDASLCSDPVARGPDEEVGDDVLTHRASLGARSDSMASVYSGAGEGRHGRVAVKGEVQFGLQYNYKLSSLEIRVQCCRDLAAVDAKRNRSDPYVKVYLLPDKSKTGKRKTKVKKHTLNPVFDDILRFQVDIKELEQRTLWLTVWHSDMFGRNDFLGEVLMPLENKVFDDPLPKYYTLQERSETLEELNSKGDLIVGLKYEPPEGNGSSKKRPSKGTLYVLVKEAKNLPAVKSTGTSDPFCKSYLLPDKGRSSKQKAPVIKKTCSPAWNHTFTYHNVCWEELAERSLELTVWDHDRLASNEFLGGVRLNLGTGKLDGKPVEWMDSSGGEVTLWQRMMEKPKFWVEGCLPLRPTLGIRRSHDL